MPQLLITELIENLQAHAHATIATQQAAYMKNHFVFYGVPKPLRAQILKALLKKHTFTQEQELITLLEYLWLQDFRELQYCAIEITDHYKKLWSPEILPIFKKLITQKSWWDSVDGLAMLVGKLILKYPELIIDLDSWINHENMWIVRTAIIAQRSFKHKTDEARLFKYCKARMHEKEFFIRKAIGWALREYSKVNPQSVAQFIEDNRTNMSTLSIREGSKYI